MIHWYPRLPDRPCRPPSVRWLSCYLRGRQAAATSFRGTKSSTRIVRTGVPQGSTLPSLFNYYIADMPRPTPLVKRVCYADDITVWATGTKIPPLESMINNYLREVSIYLKDTSLLISAPKSTVTLFTPDKHQFQMHPDITLEDTQLPLERSPKILGVIMDPPISFHKHCNYVSDRIDKRNNMLKALVGSSWGRRMRLYCWSDSSFKKIQTAQSSALRTATGAHKITSTDQLHQEDHSDMFSVQYLVCRRTTCCCLPTPMTLASGGSPMFPLVVHQPASPSIWPAVQSLRRGSVHKEPRLS